MLGRAGRACYGFRRLRLPRLLLALVCTGASAQPRARLVSVRSSGDAATSTVELEGDRPLSFTTLKLQAPPRVVVDCAETDLALPQRRLDVDDGTVRRVGVAAAGARTARVVIELAGDAEFEVRASGKRVSVRMPRLAPLVASRAGPTTPETARGAAADGRGEAPLATGGPQAVAKAVPQPVADVDRQPFANAESPPIVIARAEPPPSREPPRPEPAKPRESPAPVVAAGSSAPTTVIEPPAPAVVVQPPPSSAATPAPSRTAQVEPAQQPAAVPRETDATKRAALPTVSLMGSRPSPVEGPAPAPRQRIVASAAQRPRPAAAQKSASAHKPLAITGIGFHPTGGGAVIVRSDKPLEYGVSEPGSASGPAILLHLRGAAISSANNRRPIDTRVFDGPVQRIVPLAVPGGTDVRIELRGNPGYELHQDGGVLTVTFASP